MSTSSVCSWEGNRRLALHKSSCVTDSVVYSAMGLMKQRRTHCLNSKASFVFFLQKLKC